ncbi:MAG: hypothetical protein AAFX40_09300 [Cyanobacteria bacterium J06639_1]
MPNAAPPDDEISLAPGHGCWVACLVLMLVLGVAAGSVVYIFRLPAPVSEEEAAATAEASSAASSSPTAVPTAAP